MLAVLADAVYGRAVASGVREYAAKHAPHWLFYFEGSCSRAAVQAGLRLAAKAWHAQGFTLGLRVPEEVAALGADDDEFVCGMCVPPLSSVIVPAHAIGYRAAELLDRLLRGAAPAASPLLIAPSGIASRQSTDVVAVDDRNTADALRYIHAQAHRPITVHDVLKAAPQSRRLLELRFRQVLGRTPKEEIRRVHLERAKSLLAQTDLKIENLAAESGFRHYSFFVRRFRAYTGMTPTAFRNQFGGVRGHRKPAS